MLSQKNVLTLACCLALLIASAFYILFCAAGDGIPASPEPDQTIYLQYARNIALGQPYVFSAGDAPSTGSTTHLYPFILAAFYKLGAADDALFTASFALNSLIYLAIGLLCWLAAKKLYPKIATLVLFTALVSGHTVAAVFSQTDVGFFALLALAAITATLYDKKWLMLAMIILCAVTRPEGAIFSMAYLATGTAGLAFGGKFETAPGSKSQSKWFLVCAFAGLAAFASTLLINHLLTGHTMFMSVANKGYFKQYPFFGAIEQTLFDLMSLLKGFLFGLPNSGGRQFYHVPLVAGFLGIAGILLYPRKDKKIRLCEFWILLCIAGSLATVAASSWQGISYDRYLAWVFPVWTWYILIGAFQLNLRQNSRFFLPVCCTLIIGYQLISLTFVFSHKFSTTTSLNQQKNFAKKIDKLLPPEARLGSMVGGSGILYYIPEHKLYNLLGILSPDFFDADFSNDPARIIDRLKHRPELRFEYWLGYSKREIARKWAQPLMGNAILIDTDTALSNPRALAVYPAKWEALDGGETPVLIGEQLKGLQLIDSLDIGYCPHERAHSYTEYSRLKNTIINLCTKYAKLDDKPYSEVGRIIMGSESFTIHNTIPGKPVRMVLRSSRSAAGKCFVGRQTSSIEHLEMNNPLTLGIYIDDVAAAWPTVSIPNAEFQEVVLDIPAAFVTGTELDVEIAGDHISYAYWFYQ
ncbi:hypothetical protein [Pontiella sulfatireligans]|uniref:Glycosyltransferase RgtA/B/C/D-like domain-containing protein n=1 Tax=Pontiella sulfatireligans TaxID=2750658 RepID=A0A6C2ULC8_9BACT|nr:hypothetical protein [Pontiella sulfatireligans]VGO20908.1 hypothetical protein SCARR_02975 [Pontiella sulfatireligans]